MEAERVNVGLRLAQTAAADPEGIAVVEPGRRGRDGKRTYRCLTFAQLDADSDLLADGLRTMGVPPEARMVLMVRPSIDFIALVFALFKAGMVSVLIDPGSGRRSLIQCLREVQPDGFVAIPLAHAIRCVLRRCFPHARWNVTVGKRWFWGGATIGQLRQRQLSADFEPRATRAEDPAAIIFTTGSTGPPKGVLYRHGNFDRQVTELRDFYRIAPGEIDLACFPLFGLFNCAMGVTTVIPVMDATRPAEVDPRDILEAAHDWQITQSFGSPALWNVVGRYCEAQGESLPTLRRVLSAGAPVPPHVLQRMKQVIHSEGDVHTPYGATESLPVASIAASEVLADTVERSIEGAGTCVGRRFPGIEWKVIRIDDGPIATRAEAVELPTGEVGELMVRGPVVTTEYVTRCEANALHKVRDGDSFWHRIGDLGYLDDQDRFWFCGRKSHRLQTADGPMYTIPCEAILNGHPAVYRSALIGLGPAGQHVPVMVVEPWPEHYPRSQAQRQRLLAELQQRAASHPRTHAVQRILLRRRLPVDIRHNAKIFREKLVPWAERQSG